MVDRKADVALFKNIDRKGKAALALNKPMPALLDPELGTLPHWYTKESKSSQRSKPAKIAKWRAIVADGTLPPVNEEWIPENEAKLERLRKKDIKMDDTAYGRLLAGRKKELIAELGKSTKAERVE